MNRNHSPLLDTYFTLHLCSGKDRISRGETPTVFTLNVCTVATTNRLLGGALNPDIFPDANAKRVTNFIPYFIQLLPRPLV